MVGGLLLAKPWLKNIGNLSFNLKQILYFGMIFLDFTNFWPLLGIKMEKREGRDGRVIIADLICVKLINVFPPEFSSQNPSFLL